jgi:hypothetical protein
MGGTPPWTANEEIAWDRLSAIGDRREAIEAKGIF